MAADVADGAVFVQHFDHGGPVFDEHLQFGVASLFPSQDHAFGPTQRQRLAGAHGDQVALDFGHEPEREAEHLAVDRVVEGVLLLGGVQVDSALEAFAHDSHDVGERPAQAGYFRHDQRVSPLHALQQPSEFAVLLFRLAADYLGHPVGYHQLPAFGETSDFVLLIGQILFARTDP